MSFDADETLFLQSLGFQIRQLRKARGWSQEDLASHSGLHRTYIGSIERGEQNVSSLNIRKIAKALDLPPAYLFVGVDEGQK